MKGSHVQLMMTVKDGSFVELTKSVGIHVMEVLDVVAVMVQKAIAKMGKVAVAMTVNVKVLLYVEKETVPG